jgi:hypothetical protein
MIIHTPPNLGRKSSHESAVIPHHTLNKWEKSRDL